MYFRRTVYQRKTRNGTAYSETAWHSGRVDVSLKVNGVWVCFERMMGEEMRLFFFEF